MSGASQPFIQALYRYPVKGLSPAPLSAAELIPGRTIPFDRAYAIENGPGRFDPENPRHLPKISFLMLMRDERLATLETRFDDATETLTILRDGKQVARGQLSTSIGRQLIEQFLAAYMKAELRGPPKIVHAAGHSFSDVAAKCLHIVNMASVRELEKVVGRPINPLRFRANLYLDGVTPGRSSIGWAGIFASARRGYASSSLPSAVRQPMSTRTRGHATWPSLQRCSEPGAMPTSAFTPK